MPKIKTAVKAGKKVISLQEGLYAGGTWKKTLPSMKQECRTANELKVMQVVWSKFERKNYISTSKDPGLIIDLGNPEYDDLLLPSVSRASMGIPDDAFVITHICQYAHKAGGPNKEQLEQMTKDIKRLVELNDRIWTITCLHPQYPKKIKLTIEGRNIIRPFQYPIFNVLKNSDLIINLSSTEGITAAILKKNMIEYDISNSPSRWPFVAHGVAVRATSRDVLHGLVINFMQDKIKLNRIIDYKNSYHVDGFASERIAKFIIGYFFGNV